MHMAGNPTIYTVGFKNCYQVDSMKVNDSPLMSNIFYFDKNR